MSVEKSFTDFIVLHEKKVLSKDVRNLEGDITSITERIENISANKEEISKTLMRLSEDLRLLKVVLTKNNLYDL
jgi:chromosome segregation ATPase